MAAITWHIFGTIQIMVALWDSRIVTIAVIMMSWRMKVLYIFLGVVLGHPAIFKCFKRNYQLYNFINDIKLTLKTFKLT